MQSQEAIMSVDHIWNRLHFKWLMAGAFSGILSGAIILLIAIFFSIKSTGDWSQPLKLVGATVYGPKATAFGPLGAAGTLGGLIHFALCILYGVVFAHLVHEDSSRKSIIILAMVTSFIIWIFGFLLFMPSFNLSLMNALSTPVSLLLHFLFGFTFGVVLSGIRPIFLK